MQFSTSLLYTALFISSATALPRNIAARNAEFACVTPPLLYGCGTALFPKCCTYEDYQKLHSSLSQATSTLSPTTTSVPSVATTSIVPLVATSTTHTTSTTTSHSSSTSTPHSTSTPTTRATSAQATHPIATPVGHPVSVSNTLTPRGPGPACVIPPFLYGCGTSLAPRCCTYEEWVEQNASSSAAAASATSN